MKISFVKLGPENQIIKKAFLKKVSDMIDRSSFALGEESKLFEKDFAKFCGAKFCLGLGSGTDALHAALLACGVKKGDEVITTPISYTATSLAIAYTGAKPVFVDVLNDGNIDPSKIEKAITPKTKAILVVHMYGNPCDLSKIGAIAQKHKLLVIDDCAHSHGAVYRGKKIGSLTDISCWSFYPTKNLGAWGNAGAITTNNKELLDRAFLFKNFGGLDKNNSKVIGYNYRLDDMQAMILSLKLKHLAQANKKRQSVARGYNKELIGVGDIKMLPFSTDCSYYVFTIKTKDRDALQKFLVDRGVQTFIHYPLPIHLQECFKYLKYKKGDFPVAELHAQTVLSLPCYPSMLLNEQRYVVSVIKEFFPKSI